MANFYDLETDLEVEDVSSGDGYDYEEEYEEYEEVTEFGVYDEAAADAKWGEMEFEQLVVELGDILARSKKFFFSKKKRIVDGEEITHLIQFIQNKLPSEIINARDVLERESSIIAAAKQEKDSILAEAHRQELETVNKAKSYYTDTVKKAQDDAATIIAKAKQQAQEMVEESNIYKMAREEAERIKESTERETQAMIAKTTDECDELKEHAKQYAISVTEGARNFVASSLAGYQGIAMTNLDQINKVNTQFQSEYAAQVRALGIDE
ncbi:MAG: hypothetical protein IKJ27_01395 [Clostridia bacterium]|nr:hypothetical protein [Clostridia bacterium]